MLVLSLFGVGNAGWLDDAAKSVGEGIGRQMMESGSRSQDATRSPSDDAAKDKGAVTGAKPPQDTVEKSGGDSGAGVPIEQAEAVYSKYDFIPGDKVIFFDDFSDTDVGEFPRKWTLNGPEAKGSNPVEVVQFSGSRFLRSAPADKDKSQGSSTQYVRLNVGRDLPERFTVEFDAHFHEAGGGYPSRYGLLLLPEESSIGWGQVGNVWLSGDRCQSMNTETQISRNDNKAHHVAVSVNGTFVKAYVDNQRVLNDPDGVKRPIRFLGLRVESFEDVPNDKVMITNFRLAEGGKSIRSALDTDGKIVTHGILFDTGKDALKPESLPTLKMILGLLNQDPGLRFSIEGHTDSQGSKAVNQPLSERRATAVKTWLTGKGIQEARLRTKGFGDSKPIDSNATPEGRANNRRVEFVKF